HRHRRHPAPEVQSPAPGSARPHDRRATGPTRTGDDPPHQEALREALLDEGEGADILMVKPALAYLDVIQNLKQNTGLPIACYNVSGEYAMVKAAAERGWIDEQKVVMETMHAFARAGASIITTYHIKDILENNWM
ncbi:MAG: hypothetical protein EOO88_34910, partial [Pedobacter sp.]